MKKLESLSEFRAYKLSISQAAFISGGQTAGAITGGYSAPISRDRSSTGTVTYSSDVSDGNGGYSESSGGVDVAGGLTYTGAGGSLAGTSYRY